MYLRCLRRRPRLQLAPRHAPGRSSRSSRSWPPGPRSVADVVESGRRPRTRRGVGRCAARRARGCWSRPAICVVALGLDRPAVARRLAPALPAYIRKLVEVAIAGSCIAFPALCRRCPRTRPVPRPVPSRSSPINRSCAPRRRTAARPAAPTPPPRRASDGRVVVRPGDNLWLIARGTRSLHAPGTAPARTRDRALLARGHRREPATLRSGDPSLIFPGEIVTLPPRSERCPSLRRVGLLAGKIAVVTGAGGGIGRGHARLLAARRRARRRQRPRRRTGRGDGRRDRRRGRHRDAERPQRRDVERRRRARRRTRSPRTGASTSSSTTPGSCATRCRST